MKKKQIALAAALGCTLLLAGHALAAGAGSEPAELDADTVEYDMTTGVIQATDNVLMKQGDTHIAGQRAVYNTKTQQGTVTGGVIAVRGAMRMTCQEVIADGREHIRATGDVHGTENDKSFSSEQVDYFPQQNDYVLMEQGGVVSDRDGTFTAARMEGWLKDEHYVGTGSAHLVSPARNMEAGGARMEYFGQDRGRVVAEGNAWAVQDNNTMHSNRITIYLAKDGQATVQ